MPGHGEKTRLQHAFLAQLLVVPTVREAAAAAGISQDTATKWLKEPTFLRAYEEARHQQVEDVLRFLSISMAGAVNRLNHLLMSAEASPAVQLGAARSILELGIKAWELNKLMLRLTKIEEMLALTKGTP